MNRRTVMLAPGWRMSEAQRRLFWELWAQACAWQGWDKLPTAEREEKRRQALAECGFASAKRIDATHGFDRVKRHLEALAGIVHNEPDDAGERRRARVRADAALTDLAAAGYPRAAINTILHEHFHIVSGLRSLDDLNARDLVQVSMTLTARLASWRKPHCNAPKTHCKTPISTIPLPSQIALFG